MGSPTSFTPRIFFRTGTKTRGGSLKRVSRYAIVLLRRIAPTCDPFYQENGGQVIEKVPREGFVVVDPSPEWQSNFGTSYKILRKCHDTVHFPCRWVVHWKFVHDTVRLGRLEGRLLREYGFPAVGRQPEEHSQSNPPLLERMRVWSLAKNDVFGGKDKAEGSETFKCFAETLRIHIWKGVVDDERDKLVQMIQVRSSMEDWSPTHITL
jgi:hypothetical protein